MLGTEYTSAFSANFPEQYPDLHQKLNQSNDDIEWVCLGPGGTFFARLEDSVLYKLPRAISSQIETIIDDGIAAVALGIDETYIIVHGDRIKWNLKGHYGKLDVYLKKANEAKSAPKVYSPELPKCSKTRIMLTTVFAKNSS